VAVSHDDKWVVSGSMDKGVTVLGLRTGVPQYLLRGYKNSVGSDLYL